jgi:hypothetical protein
MLLRLWRLLFCPLDRESTRALRQLAAALKTNPTTTIHIEWDGQVRAGASCASLVARSYLIDLGVAPEQVKLGFPSVRGQA